MEKIPALNKASSLSQFLKSYLGLLKTAYGSEAVKAWAEGVGIRSRMLFKRILSGERRPSSRQLQKMQDALDLGQQDRERMNSLFKGNPPPVTDTPNKEKVFVSDEFFATPLNTIIFKLCGIPTAMSSASIKHILKGAFADSDIDQSISLLRSLKLIDLQGDKLFAIFQGDITTIPGVKSKSAREYFKSCYAFADIAWEFPLDVREIGAFTFTLDEKDIPQMKDLVRRFRQDLCRISAPSNRNSVFQCAVASFPIYLDKAGS